MPPQPPPARRRLRREQGHGDPRDPGGRDAAGQRGPDAGEQQDADEGLTEVVGERHPARRRERRDHRPAAAAVYEPEHRRRVGGGEQRRGEHVETHGARLVGGVVQTHGRVYDAAQQSGRAARPLEPPQEPLVRAGVCEGPPTAGRQPQQEGGERGRRLEEDQQEGHVRQLVEVGADDRGRPAAQRVGRPGGGGRRGLRDHAVRARLPGGEREEPVPDGGHHEERHRDAHGGAGPDAAQREQEEAEHGVEREDVAGEEDDGVHGADDEEAGQAAQKAGREAVAAPLGGVDLQREAVAEQEREQQEELRLEEHRHHPAGGLAQRAAEARVLQAGAVVGGGHVGDVDHEDAEEREAAQRVHLRQPGAGVPPPLPCGGEGRRVAVRTRPGVHPHL